MLPIQDHSWFGIDEAFDPEDFEIAELKYEAFGRVRPALNWRVACSVRQIDLFDLVLLRNQFKDINEFNPGGG